MRTRTLCCCLVWITPWLANAAEDSTAVEQVVSSQGRRRNELGTKFYEPSDQERPFFAKLEANQQSTGGLAGDYDIAKQQDKFVGWFGIVRDVSENAHERKTTLVIEHKYFDGLTDTHIQALSFNGSGDFVADLRGIELGIEPLTLVKVYGTVGALDTAQRPRVKADFVRNWIWGAFTFLMASGHQRGSEQWRKLNKVALDDIYDSDPDDDYYIQRLGPLDPKVLEQRDDRFLRTVGPLEPKLEAKLKFLVKGLRENPTQLVRSSGLEPFCRTIQELNGDGPAATILVSILKAPRYQSCQDEIEFVLRRFPAAAVSELIKSLDDPLPSSRAAAARALYSLDELAEAAVPSLVKKLQDQKDVQLAVIHALSGIRNTSDPVRDGLRSLLQNPETRVHIQAARCLIDLGLDDGAGMKILAAELKNKDSSVRVETAWALQRLDALAEPVLPSLIAALEDDETGVRRSAVLTLGEITSIASVDALASALSNPDEDKYVRVYSARSLGNIGPDAESTIPLLLKATESTDYFMRRTVAEAVGRIGKRPEECVPVLMRLLADNSDYVRGAAADALARFSNRAEAVTPDLLKVLRSDASWLCRSSAAEALGEISHSEETVQTLALMLKDPQESVRLFSARSLGTIGKDAADIRPKLIAAMATENGLPRITMASAIILTGGDPEPSLKVLSDVLRNSRNSNELARAGNEISRIKGAGKSLVPELMVVAQSDGYYARMSSALALGSIGVDASEAVPILEAMLNDPVGVVRVRAAEAVWHIARQTKALTELQGALRLRYEEERALAATALGDIGPDAREVVPALKLALKDRKLAVRRAAQAALLKIANE